MSLFSFVVRGTAIHRVVVMLVLLPAVARAQSRMPDGPHRHLSLHPVIGVFVPMGIASDALTAGPLSGGQLGVTLGPWRAPRAAVVVTGFGARTRLRGPGAADRRRAVLFAFDVGLETGARVAHGDDRRTPIMPFLGIGIGGRTYSDPDGSGPRLRTGGTGYLSVGSELGRRRTRMRLEGRSYWSRIDARGRASSLRGEIVAIAGLAYHFR